jgi:hypothetical protein
MSLSLQHRHTSVHTSESVLVAQRAPTVEPAPSHTYAANTTVAFPFEFTVPADPNAIPATMSLGSDVRIQYAIQAVAHVSGGLMQTNLSATVSVIMEEMLAVAPNEEALNPLVMSNDIKVYSHWFAPCDCAGFEGIRSVMTVPSVAYMNGETVTIQLHIQNTSTYQIDRIEVELHDLTIRQAQGATQHGANVVWKKTIPAQVLPAATVAIEPSFQITDLKRNIKLGNFVRVNKLKISLHINGHWEHIKSVRRHEINLHVQTYGTLQ